MRKWLIGAGALVLAAAIGVTVWAVTRSNGPTEYDSPAEAVLAACPADPSRPPQRLGDTLYPSVLIKEQGLDMTWLRRGDPETKPHIAVLQVTDGSKYRLVTCTATLDHQASH